MARQTELDVKGDGVERLEIPEIEKAIAKYQRKKEARCQVSPGELEAKRELQAALHIHRDNLPVNAEGIPFYRCDDRDYLLSEKLLVKKVETDEEDE